LFIFLPTFPLSSSELSVIVIAHLRDLLTYATSIPR
jgi:hypothetical protein